MGSMECGAVDGSSVRLSSNLSACSGRAPAAAVCIQQGSEIPRTNTRGQPRPLLPISPPSQPHAYSTIFPAAAQHTYDKNACACCASVPHSMSVSQEQLSHLLSDLVAQGNVAAEGGRYRFRTKLTPQPTRTGSPSPQPVRAARGSSSETSAAQASGGHLGWHLRRQGWRGMSDVCCCTLSSVLSSPAVV